MAIAPSNSSELIRITKRVIGLIVVTFGSLIMLGVFVWLAAYFIERGLSLEALQRSFGAELLYWIPVLFFCIPGFMLLFHGKRLMRNDAINWLEFLMVITVTGLVIFTLINFEL